VEAASASPKFVNKYRVLCPACGATLEEIRGEA